MTTLALSNNAGFELRFDGLAARLDRWKLKRQTRRELTHLTERQLADIGLTRGDIEPLIREL